MKKTKKIILLTILFLGLAILFNFNKVYAASASITGNQTITVGQSIQIVGTVNAGAWNMVLARKWKFCWFSWSDFNYK